MEQQKWPNVVKNILNYVQIILVALRACDVITWPWWVVLSPILARAALFLMAAAVGKGKWGRNTVVIGMK